MSAEKKDHYIILIENYWEGYFHNVAWFSALIAMITYAVWIESTAMQWVMGALWFLVMIGWAHERTKKRRLTIDEALDRIQQIQLEHGPNK